MIHVGIQQHPSVTTSRVILRDITVEPRFFLEANFSEIIHSWSRHSIQLKLLNFRIRGQQGTK